MSIFCVCKEFPVVNNNNRPSALYIFNSTEQTDEQNEMEQI